MKIEYSLPFRHAPLPLTESIAPAVEPPGRAPRIARLVALAHRLDQLVRSGEVSDYAALARLGHISPARLTQLMTLLHLSPAIQDYVLFLQRMPASFRNSASENCARAALATPANRLRATSRAENRLHFPQKADGQRCSLRAVNHSSNSCRGATYSGAESLSPLVNAKVL
jgi:hypothetical protein